MEMKAGILYLLGCGPGAEDYITPRARSIAAQAEFLIGCPRTLLPFENLHAERLILDRNLEQLLLEANQLLQKNRKVAWLCTGDTSLYSVAHTAIRKLGGNRCILEPGISSVQVACARLGAELSEVSVQSAHGRAWNFQSILTQKHLCLLSGSQSNLESILHCAGTLKSTHSLFVCSDLSLPTEKISSIIPSEIHHWIAHPNHLFFWKCNE